MLRQVFYGGNSPRSNREDFRLDAQPREVFITVCLLLPIIAISMYPKLATSSYDSKTIEVASKTRSALPIIVQQKADDVGSNYGFMTTVPNAKLSRTVAMTAPTLP